jgi:hypothetical protein
MFNECIEWRGARTNEGYGRKWKNGKVRYTHRLAYAWANGPIPDGMWVLHKCDNPPCCNPEHLFLGTNQDNLLDCISKGRHPKTNQTHCKHGHEFTPKNTYVHHNGHRACRACHARHERHRRRRNHERRSSKITLVPVCANRC